MHWKRKSTLVNIHFNLEYYLIGGDTVQAKNVVLLFKLLLHDNPGIHVQLKEEIAKGSYELNEILEKLIAAMETEEED